MLHSTYTPRAVCKVVSILYRVGAWECLNVPANVDADRWPSFLAWSAIQLGVWNEIRCPSPSLDCFLSKGYQAGGVLLKVVHIPREYLQVVLCCT